MKSIHLDHNAYREYAQKHMNSDLFVCINQVYRIECSKNEISIQHSFVSGMSTCVYSHDSLIFSACNGVAKENIIDLERNPIAQAVLPGKPFHLPIKKGKESNNCIPQFKLVDISEKQCREIWCYLADRLSQQKKTISSLMLHLNNDAYYFFSQRGNEGYSERMLFAPGITLEQDSACFYNLTPFFDMKSIDNIIENVQYSVADLPDVNGYDLPHHILLSGSAACELVFYLLMMLSEPMVESNNSPISYSDIGTDYFSKVLNIEENSISNKTILGTVDGEGVLRIPTMIVEHGKIVSLFTSGMENLDILSTGSMYRFSHTDIPQVRPSKVSVRGNQPVSSIMQNYRDIILIDNISGHRESMSLKSSYFEAYARGTVIKQGIRIARCMVRIRTSLNEIFKNVICIGDDEHYGVDGSIISGSILIEDKGIICRS